MISYDNYKNRIQKLAKAKKIAHKFRFLIMGVLAVILGGTVGLMLAKGTYTSGMTLSAQTVLFNQPYEITPAKAFLDSPRSQKIEYSSDSEQWVTEKPVKAGKYYARTVSPKIVGYSYSKPVEFEIIPIDAQFDIVGNSVVYGEVPRYSVPQLISGHRVADEELVFNYADYGAASTEVSADQSTFKIVDADGDDFTNCYNVTFTPKTLTVSNRKITVSPNDYSFAYNGAAQTAENVVSESTEKMLAKGDRAEVVTGIYKNGIRVSAVDAGNYTVDIDGIKIMHGSIDVTARYDIQYVSSAFKILQRELTFISKDATKTYDGEKLTNSGYDKENLIDGHEIVLPEVMPYALNVSDSKAGNNAYEITITDSNGADVTANYDIKYTYGTLTVEKRALSFTTDSATKTYDGVALTQDRYFETNLVNGHEIELAGNSLPSQIKAGTTKNVYEIYITDGLGNYVTENYDIKYSYGTLTVNKRKITVSTGDLTAVFNGEMQTNTDYKSVGGDGLVNDYAHSLIHTLQTDVPFAVKDVTVAAGVNNTTTYKVTDGLADVTENYDITYEGYYGKIIINPRKIYVETSSVSRVYNGEPLTAYEEKDKDYFTYYINEDGIREEGLKGDDTLTLSGKPASITEFGTASNVCKYVAGGNYEIDENNYVYGTLEITARRISVTTASDSRQYNGTALSKTDEYKTVWLDGVNGNEAGLLNSDKLSVIESSVPSIINKGKIYNTVKYTVPNSNYEIVESAYEWGTLEITARQIYVITRSDKKEYDGEPLEASDGYKTKWIDDDGNKTEEAGLLNGDELTVYMPCAIYEVGGPETNSPRYNTNGNYTIITEKNEYGTLTITPRPIIVTTASLTKTYDGKQMSKTDGYVVNYAVKNADGLWVADTTKKGLITRNGVQDELTCSYEFIYDGAVTDSKGVDNACEYEHKNSFDKSNYNIHYAYGKFIVTGRAIKVITPDATKVYDGNPLSETDDYETYLVDENGAYILDEKGSKQAGLLGEDKLNVNGKAPSITNVGTLSNTVAYTAPDNYVINGYDYGTLKVTKREIYVYINSASKVYDGTPLSETGYRTYLRGDLTGDLTQIEEDGLIGGDKLKITVGTVPSIINVDTATNVFDFALPLNENGECNYTLLDTYAGELEITARTIYVVTGDGEWTYDGGAHSQPVCKDAYYLNEKGEKETALVFGHELKAIESTVTQITNYMGENGIENLTEYKVVIATDGAEAGEGFTVNDNYHIEYPEYGRLKIKKAALAVQGLMYVNENALTYGEKFTYPTGAGNYKIANGLVNGEGIEIFVVVLKADERWDSLVNTDEIQPDENGAYALAAGNYALNCLRLKDSFKIWKNGVEVTYVNENGETVSGINNYTVVASKGTLTVNKKAITVTVDDRSCEYGGLDGMGEMPENEYKVTAGLDENGLLPYGEDFTFEYLYKNAEGECTPKNKGDYTIFVNEKTIIVNGADGEVENGAANYDITFVEGTLKIETKTIELTIHGTDIYYGVSIGNLYVQTLEEGEESPLCYGEELSILVDYFDSEGNSVTRPKDAGVYTIKAKEGGYILQDANGVSIPEGLNNYEIKVKDGSLEVLRLPVTIIIDNAECEYGGLDGMGKLPENGYSVEAVDGRNPHPYGETFNLVYGYLNADGTPCTPKNADSYQITATATVDGTGVSGDKNYDIEWVYGTLEITEKQLTFIIEDQTVVYGDEIPDVEWYFATDDTFVNGYWEKDENFRLPYGEKIIAGGFYYYYYVGEESFCLHKGDVFNVRTYSIHANYYACSDGAVRENYIISIGWNKNNSRGKLTVTPRPIELEIDEIATVIYGDTFAYASKTGNYLGAPDLKNGDSLQIAVKYLQNNAEVEAKNAGTYTADIDLSKCIVYRGGAEVKFVNDGGEEVGGINNYSVTCKSRDCEILRRELKIKLNDLTVTYGDYDFAAANPYYAVYNAAVNGIGNYDVSNSSELAWGEQISVKVGYVENKTPLSDFITPKNAGTYKIIIGDGIIFYDSDGNEIVDGGVNYCGSRADRAGYTCTPSKLEITQRDIKVSINDLLNISYGYYDFSKVNPYYEVYEGLNNYDLNNSDALCYGEQLKISVIYQQGGEESVTPKNVGSYVIALDDYEVFDKNDNSLGGVGKNNYKLSANAGALEIVQKMLFVMIDDKETVYGGDIPENSFEIRDGYTGPGIISPVVLTELPYGEQLQLSYFYTYVINGLGEQMTGDDRFDTLTPKFAGKYQIRENESGRTINGSEDGLANYDISTSTGRLTIKRAKLAVTLSDIGQVVYGMPFEYLKSDYTATGLQYGETLEVAVFYSRDGVPVEAKNVGNYSIEIDKVNTLACDAGENGAKRKVELNYEIISDVECNGAVEIVARKVTVSFISASCTYGDGLPEIGFTLNVDVSDDTYGELSATKLPNGEKLSFRHYFLNGLGYCVEPVNAGSYLIRVDEAYVTDTDGKTTGADNYELSYPYYGGLIINKKDIHIKLDDMSATYGDFYVSGVPATQTFKLAEGEGEALANNEKLTVNIKFTAKGDEATENFVKPQNAGKYSVVANSFTVGSVINGVSVTETAKGNALTNYNIVCDFAELNIAKRAITVTVDEDTSYDYGDKPKINDVEITVNGVEYTLPYNETLNCSLMYFDEDGVEDLNHYNAGVYTVKIDRATATINMAVPVTDNYEPDFVDGKLTVNKKAITVKVESFDRPYGTVISAIKVPYTVCDINGVVLSQLPFGDVLNLTFKYGNGSEWTVEPQNAGIYAIDIATASVSGGNGRVENYEITPDFGTLEITEFTVNVTITGDEVTYGGEYEITYSYPEILPNSEKLSLEFEFIDTETGKQVQEPTAAGTYKIKVANEIVSGGNGSADNYNIVYAENDPALIINKKAIKLTLNAGGTVNYEYGLSFNDSENGVRAYYAEGLLDGQYIEIAVIYSSLSGAYKRSASPAKKATAYAAQLFAAEDNFMPRSVGRYLAELDWNNCVLYNADGTKADGGMNNYKWAEGFECESVEFQIVPMTVTVTVTNDSAPYGVDVSEVKINYTVNESLPYDEVLTLAFNIKDGAEKAQNAGTYTITIADVFVDNGSPENYAVDYSDENPAPEFTITQKELNIVLYDMSVEYKKEVKYPAGLNNYEISESTDTEYGEQIEITEVEYFDENGDKANEFNVTDYGYDIVLVTFAVYDKKGNFLESGGNNYAVNTESCRGKLTITTLGIKITTGSDKKEYDGTPLYCETYSVEGELAEGYSIVVDKLNGPTDVTSAIGVDNLTKFKVQYNGVDSNNYAIDYNPNCGKLIVTPRKIKISTENASKYYDGKPLQTDYKLEYIGATQGGKALGSGDSIEATTEALTEWRSAAVQNSVTYVIKNSEGEEVTGNYAVTESFGTLYINKVEIDVTLNNINNHVYGEEIGELYTLTVHLTDAEISATLPNEEELVFDIVARKSGVVYSAESRLSVGDYQTSVSKSSIKIVGGNANLDNYKINSASIGSISIVKRGLTVTVNDGEWTYDGKTYSEGGYAKAEYITADGEVKQGLLDGDGELRVKAGFKLPEITAIGTVINHVEYDVPNDNYEIVKIIDGELKIIAREITVKTGDINCVYDGEAHSNDSLSLTAGTLADDQSFLVQSFDSWTYATAGNDIINEVTYIICDKDGYDVTSNYAITDVHGKVVISKRLVKVTTDGFEGEYNGGEQGTDGYNVTNNGVADEGLLTAFNHVLVVTKSFTRKDATINETNGYVYNETEFGVFLNDKNGADLTANYDIAVTAGKVIINQKAITVTLNTVSVPYGSTSYFSELNNAAVIDGLIGDEGLTLAFTYDKEVGDIDTYTATLDWDNAFGINGGNINNYKCVNAVDPAVQFTVYAKSISVELNGSVTSFEYGNGKFAEIANAAVEGTVNGETLVVALKYQDKDGNDLETAPVYKGEYKAVLDWANSNIMLNGTEKKNGLNNYEEPDCAPVSFSITERKVKITTLNVTVEYGKEIAYPDRTENEENYAKVENLREGEILEVTSVKYMQNGEEVSPLFAGKYDIVVTGIKVTAADGRNVTDNYVFETAEPYGELEIEGVSLVITRLSQSKIYDGAPLSLESYAVNDGISYTIAGQSVLLPEGYTIVLDTSEGVYTTDGANVQSVVNTAKYKVIGSDGNEAGEYVVSYDESIEATLEITQREIKYSTDSESKPYDGSALTAGFSLDTAQLVSSHTAVGTQLNLPVNVNDSCTNEYSFTVTDGVEDVTANYKFVPETLGTLTIEKVKVTVSVNNVNAVYGEEIGDNGITLTDEEGNVIALPNGETVSFEVYYTDFGGDAVSGLLNKGSYKIVANETTVAVDKNGKGNYDFSFVSGDLTVAARTIRVITDDITKIYDGKELHVGAYTTVYITEDGIEKDGLLNGDGLVVDGNEIESKFIVNIGTLANAFAYSVPNDNYVIDTANSKNGILEITVRSIEIVTGSGEWTYDGTAHSQPVEEAVYLLGEDGNRVEGGLGLVAGHELVVSKEFSVINATEGTPNAVEYTVSDGNGDVSGNYIIKHTQGTLIVNKANLTVTLGVSGKNEFVYGEDFDTEIKSIGVSGFVGAEEFTKIEVTYNVEQPKNAGSYTAELNAEACACTVVNGTDITNGLVNYEIECEPFNFEITRKAITLVLDPWADEDYGADHYYEGSASLAAGSSFEYGESIAFVEVNIYTDAEKTDKVSAPVNSGTYYVELNDSMTMLKNSDEPLSTNYDVTCADITFKVRGIKFTLQISDVQSIYNGAEYDYVTDYNKTFKILDEKGNELNAEDLNLSYKAGYSETPVNAGDYTVTLNKADLTYDTVNYFYDGAEELSCKLAIKQRELEIIVDNLTVENDGNGNKVYTKDNISADCLWDFGGGFMGNDLEDALADGSISFKYAAQTSKPAGATGYYKVTLAIDETAEILKNYKVSYIEEGYLTVTERKVFVKPVYNGAEKTYDGNPVDLNDFAFYHEHDIVNATADDTYGFTEDQLAGITASYTFIDEKGNELAGTPVNAGKYTVKVELFGEEIGNYLVRYETLSFEIKKRTAGLTLTLDGGSEFVYGANSPDTAPAFSVSATEKQGYQGFVGGLPAIEYALMQNGETVTRYNAGEYQVGVWFEGINNYELNFNDLTVKINPRKIVIGPKAPAEGTKQQYNGSDLTLGSGDFEVLSSSIENGGIVAGDELLITANSLAPTAKGGYVKITGYTVTADGEDISGNYEVIFAYDSQNDMIRELGLNAAKFQIRMEYLPIEIHYTLAQGAGGEYAYTGSRIVHTFDPDAVIAACDAFGFGHRLTVTASSYTTPNEKAGRYENWLKNYLRVYDAEGRNVSAVYSVICDNAAEEAVVVISNVLTVELDNEDVNSLPVGKLESGYTVTGLFNENGVEHSAEVYVLDRNGKKFFGVTVFKTSGSSKIDVGTSYELAEGSVAEIVTLTEAATLSKPALAVEITVSSLEGGKGSLFTHNANGNWQLTGGYSAEGCTNGDVVSVYVYRNENGYYLGITVCDKNGNDVRANYNLYDVVTNGVEAKFISVSESSTLKREIYLDFTGATVAEDGTVTGFAVEGTPDDGRHIVEATYADGVYTVVIYEKGKIGSREVKYDRTGYYEVVSDQEVKLVNVNTLK